MLLYMSQVCIHPWRCKPWSPQVLYVTGVTQLLTAMCSKYKVAVPFRCHSNSPWMGHSEVLNPLSSKCRVQASLMQCRAPSLCPYSAQDALKDLWGLQTALHAWSFQFLRMGQSGGIRAAASCWLIAASGTYMPLYCCSPKSPTLPFFFEPGL